MELWQIWVAAALLFVIVEIFTAGFAVACFSAGAAGAAVSSACGLPLVWQVVIFAIFTILAFIFVRPAVIRLFYRKMADTNTNADALVGRQGTVSRAIPAGGRGRVAIDGDDWRALAADGAGIAEGTAVIVTGRTDSVTLSVRRA